MADLAQLPVRNARRWPDRLAYRLDDTTMTWAELDQATARVAGWLREAGVSPGDRVAITLPNTLQFPVLYYGILRRGGVVVPLNPLLHERELRHCLAVSGAGLIVACEVSADAARAAAAEVGAACHVLDAAGSAALADAAPLAEVYDAAGDDVAVILFTSGTTGRAKGAALSHDNLFGNAEVSGRTTSELTPQDTLLAALPLFHVFGQTCQMNGAAIFGSSLTLLPRFDPERALEILQRDEVTAFSGVPTMYATMLLVPGAEKYDVSHLRRCICGGAPMPVHVMHEFEARFGCTVLEGYGLSETSPVATFNNPGRPRKPGTIGPPVEGVEVGIAGPEGDLLEDGMVGEIVVRGPNVMLGYWDDPVATAETIRDGWLHTGDIGSRDADGYYTIVDRLKDMILRGGMNVYPREVEEVLYEHPAVAEAAVIGVPHDTLGEEVAAAVVLRPGESATAEEIREFVHQRIAPYKYPRLVWLTDALPKTATGKIRKRDITVPADVTMPEHTHPSSH